MKGIMKAIMLSCDKATLLVEKRIDVGLGITERMQLAMHTSMCDGCTRYRKQSELLHRLLSKHIPGGSHTPGGIITPAAYKARLIAMMKAV